MDRLESMTTLLVAVEAGSLSAASRKLGMPLATVSRKVSELETHLRTRLLVRTSRRLTLTEAGRSYVAACRRIMEDIGEAERTASGEYSAPRGEFLMTVPVGFGRLHVLPIVTDFLKSYPDINIRLVQTDRMLNLLEEHVDLAVRVGALPDSNLMATRLGAIGRVTCGAPDYFTARGTPMHPSDLSTHSCITFEVLMASNQWNFRTGTETLPVPVRSRLVVCTSEAAIDAAISGIGVTCVLSYQAAEAVRAGKLAVVLNEYEPPRVPVSLVTNGQGPLPQKLRVFLDFATPRLKARLEQCEV